MAFYVTLYRKRKDKSIHTLSYALIATYSHVLLTYHHQLLLKANFVFHLHFINEASCVIMGDNLQCIVFIFIITSIIPGDQEASEGQFIKRKMKNKDRISQYHQI